ncbi:transmembrane 9 superfamily member 2-like [Artemia franciscana]|uniref:Transmembrane 9 superfamily member n=1 Tax=Artemia franciscana TaxID=6661 RepID=A0AA88IC00_ARTSF|nr:hypothetical protein QYM36_004802 [Artemia franciscana]
MKDFGKLLVIFSCVYRVSCLYLPGLAPVNYCKADNKENNCKSTVQLFVNRLTSGEHILPYYYSQFDFCTANNKVSPVENLGQLVFGERIQSSPYELKFLEDVTCSQVCTKEYHVSDKDSKRKLDFLLEGIKRNYQHHWIVDNMPVTWCYNTESNRQYCNSGFPIGCYINPKGRKSEGCYLGTSNFDQKDSHYVYNHIDLTIKYHSGKTEPWGINLGERGGRVVAIKAEPRSIKHTADGKCDTSEHLRIPGKPQGKIAITYTYSYKFQETKIKWSSRWDYLLDSTPNSNIQWFSILISLVMILSMSGLVAMILLKTLHKDISIYNQIDSSDEAQFDENFGWKLVHGDVFRRPRKRMLLSVLVGSGVQVFLMTLVTLVFACLGFLSPANRGALTTCAMVLFVCMGSPAGYVSARIYKSFGGERWKMNLLLTSMLCPGLIFSMFFLLNIVLWANSSSATVPFPILVALLALWLAVSLPLTFVGTFFGFRKKKIDCPVRINQIPRQVPEQSLYNKPLPAFIIGGILPFGCILIQLFFILNSIWSNQMYYMFGFLFLVFIILVITCSETTILLCYLHLCAEDYHWWWRSFMTSGFTAFYMFAYCIYYYMTKLNIDPGVSSFLYFGYTFIMVTLFFIMTGTIGFFACFWFVRKIYSIVKVD